MGLRTAENVFSEQDLQMAAVFRALAHPARLQILRTLADRGSCVCGQIVEVLPLAQSTVSQHLRELKDMGLIQGEIEGNTSCYCINPDAFAAFIRSAVPFLERMATVPDGACC